MKTIKILSRLNIGLNCLVLLVYAVLCIIIFKDPPTNTPLYLWTLGAVATISLAAMIFTCIILDKKYRSWNLLPFWSFFSNALVFAITVTTLLVIFIQKGFEGTDDFNMVIFGAIASLISTIMAIVLYVLWKKKC